MDATYFFPYLVIYLILSVCALPTFFLWRWILKKKLIVDKIRKITTWITTLVLTPLFYYGIYSTYMIYIEYYPNRVFDKEKWIENKEKRYEFSKNIIESKMLIGKTKSQVRQILGDEYESFNSDSLEVYKSRAKNVYELDALDSYNMYHDGHLDIFKIRLGLKPGHTDGDIFTMVEHYYYLKVQFNDNKVINVQEEVQ